MVPGGGAESGKEHHNRIYYYLLIMICLNYYYYHKDVPVTRWRWLWVWLYDCDGCDYNYEGVRDYITVIMKLNASAQITIIPTTKMYL